MIDRRTVLAGAAAAGAMSAAAPVIAAARNGGPGRAFPRGFLWGAATAGHQVEGNNVNADCWLLENMVPSMFAEPSRDAANSFELWATDLDLVKAMGLSAYRFSLEWARIEPGQGMFSTAMLGHYRTMIAGCRARGITPLVTFNHFTTPIWFASQGGWTNPQSPSLFARFCERAARHLAADIGYATTLNEPNLPRVLAAILPPQAIAVQEEMLKAAAKKLGVAKYAAGNVIAKADMELATVNLMAGHKAARDAIKAVRPDLPVGLSLSMFDDQAVGGASSVRDAMRAQFYQPWLEAVRHDDFLGVQNYSRKIWGSSGELPPPAGAQTGDYGEVYPASLGNCVRYAHAATGLPIMVTENGVATSNDTVRALYIPLALTGLRQAMDDGVPVMGYVHWSLVDNFEWIFGYQTKFGLHTFDPVTFARTAKPSAGVYGAIAKANALPG